MKRSTERILTTHTGSLPRPKQLRDLILAGDMRRRKDDPAFQTEVRSAVAGVVGSQANSGVDVINDGEQGRVSYATYVKERLSGFGGVGTPITCSDLEAVPEYRDQVMGSGVRVPQGGCNGAVSYTGHAELQRDIDNLKRALAGLPHQEAFMSAASPGVIAHFLDNEHYASDEAYLMALADAMKTEYERLHQAGLIVQVDCPDLAMARGQKGFAQLSVKQFCEAAELRMAALNRAVAGIPPEAMRMHLCWGNYEGPHHHDVELKEIINIVLKARPAGIVLEACNPRHEHEWQLFEQVKLPNRYRDQFRRASRAGSAADRALGAAGGTRERYRGQRLRIRQRRRFRRGASRHRLDEAAGDGRRRADCQQAAVVKHRARSRR